MGIKRCPSFSKRPGFPCGLRVLLVDSNAAQRSESEELLKECSYEVTPCSSVSEALTKLSGMCSFDVLLADKPTLSSSGAAVQQLLAAADGLPCILMAAAPNAEDVMAGVELGAVDFLAKPLAPQKLRNIWQHTVRKMMCNMNISCDAAAATDGLLPPGPSGKERVSMEVIMEEADEEAAAAAAAAAGGCSSRGNSLSVEAAAAAATTPRSSTSNAPGSSVINYSNAPNMALAITSSFYGPSGASSLSRSSSGTATASQASDGSRCGSPGSPDSRPAKQQHCSHGAVRSCPSTRSLNSAGSCQSSWQLPSSPSLAKLASDASVEAAAEQAADDEAKACQMQQRCLKKAVRHPPAAAAASPVSASKPPLCSKPVAGVPAARMQQQPTAAATGAPVAAVAGAPGTSSGGMPAVLASVPLPTGLGALPQGMVWGMPMCPLVRAPGIVPPVAPAAGSMALGGQMHMSGWGMCGVPAMFGGMMPPNGGNPFMSAYSGALPMPGMLPYSSAASCMMGAAGMQSCYSMQDPAAAAAMQAAGYGHAGFMQQQQQQPQQLSHAGVGLGRAASAPTGAAAAAALGGLDLLGSGGSARSAGGLPSTADDEEAAALDFVLGDIAAEDDITDVCGSLLDADMSNLDQGLHLPAQLPTAMQALEAELQQQTAAAVARCSFDCSSMQHGGRVSFDCSAASTCTAAARASFDTSNRSCSNRVSFEVSTMSRCHSSRVSFEVQGMQAGSAAAGTEGAGAVAAAAAKMAPAASAPPTLLGSVSDLFAAACSDDSSHGSGLQHVDSCSMLADLQSLFAASGDSSCPADCADSAVADSEELFVDALGDGLDGLPLGLAMRKSNSLAQLINAGLPTAMPT